jgi:hypothetical protein
MERLRSASGDPTDGPLTVSGRVHLIEVEEPSKVAIRADDGTDWICTYSESLEPTVLGLVKQLVWARGTGARTSTGRGRMSLVEIHPLPAFGQANLFSERQRDADEVAAEQGITRPQGLDSTTDPEWVDDERDEEFLALMVGEES